MVRTSKHDGGGRAFSPNSIFSGILWGLVVYLILALLVTAAISLQSIIETKLDLLSRVSLHLGTIVTGVVAGRKANKSGWMHGLGAGLIFMLLVFILGNMFFQAPGWRAGYALTQVSVAAVLGLLGGAAGANL